MAADNTGPTGARVSVKRSAAVPGRQEFSTIRRRRMRLDDALMRLYFGYVEPLQFVFGKRRSLELFGIRDIAALPSAHLRLGGAGICPGGIAMAERHRSYLRKYLSRSEAAFWPPMRMRGTPLLIDLDSYPDFPAYLACVKRQSGGNVTRELRKAGMLGFVCRQVPAGTYAADETEILRSKRFRSGGPVLAAVLGGTAPTFRPAACGPHHWDVRWGVFAPEEREAAAGPDRLVGSITLRRVGNIVRIVTIMGHGDYLRHGIMRLLFLEIMRWFLERADTEVRGVRYIHYGAAEQGGRGLAEWKRRLQFRPFVFVEDASR
jgi:hypothetical protein